MPLITSEISGSSGTFNLKLGALDINTQTGSFNTIVAAVAWAAKQTISEKVTIPVDYNVMMFGPITIAANGSVTISAGARTKIKDLEDM